MLLSVTSPGRSPTSMHTTLAPVTSPITSPAPTRQYRTKTGLPHSMCRSFSPYTAILYAGVQDYRSKAGENRRALLLSERSPEPDSDTISALLDVPGATVREYLNTGR